jgi:hypothetical protein
MHHTHAAAAAAAAAANAAAAAAAAAANAAAAAAAAANAAAAAATTTTKIATDTAAAIYNKRHHGSFERRNGGKCRTQSAARAHVSWQYQFRLALQIRSHKLLCGFTNMYFHDLHVLTHGVCGILRYSSSLLQFRKPSVPSMMTFPLVYASKHEDTTQPMLRHMHIGLLGVIEQEASKP